MATPRILIAGIGNIFLGDDAFGVEVASELMKRSWPDGVRVIDFGIRGLDLTYALLDGCDVAILVDACPRGQPPGTLFLIEPDEPEAPTDISARDLTADDLLIETHGMHPAKVLRLVGTMGGLVKRVLLVGCEPTPFDPEVDMEMCLSEPVREAVPRAVAMIETLLKQLREGAFPQGEAYSKGQSSHEPSHSIA